MAINGLTVRRFLGKLTVTRNGRYRRETDRNPKNADNPPEKPSEAAYHETASLDASMMLGML